MNEFFGLNLPVPDVSESDTEDVWQQWDDAMHVLLEAQAQAELKAQAQMEAARLAAPPGSEATAQSLADGHAQAISDMVKRFAPPAKTNLH